MLPNTKSEKLSQEDFLLYLKEYNLGNKKRREEINKYQKVKIDNKEIEIYNKSIVCLIHKHNLKWENYNLKNINLSNIKIKLDIQGFDLYEFDLENSNLSNCDLRNSFLFRANLKNVNFENSNLSNCNLSMANLEGANLIDTYLVNSYFNSSNLKNIILSKNNYQLKNYIVSKNISLKDHELIFGSCGLLEGNFKKIIKDRFKGIIIFIKENGKEIPVGILKCLGLKTFLMIKNVVNNGEREFTIGVIYCLEKNLYEHILSLYFQKDYENKFGKFVANSLELKVLRPISCDVINEFFPLIKNLLNDIENKKIDLIQLN